MMAISFNAVKAGDVLYDVHRYKTNGGSKQGCWRVKIYEIDYEKGTAMASWNTNPPQKYFRRQIERLRRSQPKAKD